MPLTPQDVREKKFTSTRIKPGYDENEVDAFLDEVEAELERLLGAGTSTGVAVSTDEAGRSADGARPSGSVSDGSDGRVLLAPTNSGESASGDSGAGGPGSGVSVSGGSAPGVSGSAGSGSAGSGSGLIASAAQAPAADRAPTADEVGASALRTLQLAQRTADEAVAQARAEAEEILASARRNAQELEGEARERQAAVLGQLDRSRQDLEARVEQLRGFEREYHTRLRAYLEGQLRSLDNRSPDGVAGGVGTAVGGGRDTASR